MCVFPEAWTVTDGDLIIAALGASRPRHAPRASIWAAGAGAAIRGAKDQVLRPL